MEMSLFNAFVIWSQNYSSLAKKGYFDFLINVWQLIFDQKQAIPVEIPHISNRVSLKHSGSPGNQRRCKVCSTIERPKTTRKICLDCDVNSCSTKCWMIWIWHTKNSINKWRKKDNLP